MVTAQCPSSRVTIKKSNNVEQENLKEILVSQGKEQVYGHR